MEHGSTSIVQWVAIQWGQIWSASVIEGCRRRKGGNQRNRNRGKKKGDGWALSHPANGILATLSEKGPKRPFARAFSTQCSALSDFFTGFWGHFGVILRLNLLRRKSPKHCSNGPLGPNGRSKMAKNSKIGPMERFLVHFGIFWRGQLLVDLAGQQTPPSPGAGQTPPPYGAGRQTHGAGHQTPPPPHMVRRTRSPLWRGENKNIFCLVFFPQSGRLLVPRTRLGGGGVWCPAPYGGGVWCPAPEGGLLTRKIDQNLTSPKWSKML